MSDAQDRQFAVLSAIGTDRPGLVAEVTGFLREIGCNVEDSRMATLGGEFGLMMLISGTPDQVARVESGLDRLENELSLQAALRRTEAPGTRPETEFVPYVVTGYALDREGLVHAVSQALANIGVNIRALETETYHAPTTGAPLFSMTLHIDTPAGVSVGELRSLLDRVAARENIDLEIQRPS